jgi:hypothetical protein
MFIILIVVMIMVFLIDTQIFKLYTLIMEYVNYILIKLP